MLACIQSLLCMLMPLSGTPSWCWLVARESLALHLDHSCCCCATPTSTLTKVFDTPCLLAVAILVNDMLPEER